MNQDDFRKLLATPKAETSQLKNLSSNKSQRLVFGRKHKTAKLEAPRALIKRKQLSHSTSSDITRHSNAKNSGKDTRFYEEPSSEQDIELHKLHEKLRNGQITTKEYSEKSKELGGDLNTTHLVRGLDRKLLEKVRSNELALDDSLLSSSEKEVDEEADKLLEKVAEESSHPESVSILEEKKKIPLYPNGQPKYRKILENGKKVKYLLDENGEILKRLVKKEKKLKNDNERLENEHKTEKLNVNANSLGKSFVKHDIPLPPVDLKLDIFEEVGEYDPFHENDKEPAELKAKDAFQLKGHHELDAPYHKKVFDTNQYSDLKPTNFMSQIHRLAKVQERKEEEERKKGKDGQIVDAGFGLVLSKDDTADIHELGESDDDDNVKRRKTKG